VDPLDPLSFRAEATLVRYRFFTADVFTDVPFTGNQLAVFPEASGIPAERMQQIAREFNFPESVFVLPADHPDCRRRLRIFNPTTEMPFAGHPTIGTAHVLAALDVIPLEGGTADVLLEEPVGPVPVTVWGRREQPTRARLRVAQLPQESAAPDRAALATMLSLDPGDLVGDAMAPAIVSCGMPFVMVPVRSSEAVARAGADAGRFAATLAGYPADKVFVFAMSPMAGADIHARMFSPASGIPEDPATGSAAVAVGGYLAERETRRDGGFSWTIAQGIEMGRPSRLEVEVTKRDGRVTDAAVAGSTVLVSEGTMDVPEL
jgi:trans-2,3-dihydro-3-hydroxyanthranilate isomerase